MVFHRIKIAVRLGCFVVSTNKYLKGRAFIFRGLDCWSHNVRTLRPFEMPALNYHARWANIPKDLDVSATLLWWLYRNLVSIRKWACNLSMARGHPRYCGLVRGARVRKRSIPNRLKFYLIFIVYNEFTDVTASRIIQTGGPRVGNPCVSISTIVILFLGAWGRCTARSFIVLRTAAITDGCRFPVR